MKRCRFAEKQSIGILKEQEAGLKVSDLCRKHGISDATLYKWKTRYGGLEVSEAKRLGFTLLCLCPLSGTSTGSEMTNLGAQSSSHIV